MMVVLQFYLYRNFLYILLVFQMHDMMTRSVAESALVVARYKDDETWSQRLLRVSIF
jgi:hypothetical protein